jgi:hypothetical protein
MLIKRDIHKVGKKKICTLSSVIKGLILKEQ